MNYLFTLFTSLLLFLSSFQAFAFQSLDELLADPDITWVGEAYVDYHPNINILAPDAEETKNLHQTIDYNNIQILKVKNKLSEDQLNTIPSLLSEKMLQLNSSTLKIYKDSTLKAPLSYQAYQEIIQQEVTETKIGFDPETYEQIIKVIKEKLNKRNIDQFRLKQILSYNAKTNQLKISPVAIAPLQTIDKFRYIEEKALFWMPIKEAFTMLNLDAPSINWAKRFDKDISANAIKTIKGTKGLSNILMDMTLKYRENSSTVQVYQIKGDNNQLVIANPSILQDFGGGLDTIVTFDPQTFEEIVQVVETTIEVEQLRKIRVTQDWAWDEKTQSMQIRVFSFAPILYEADRNGNYYDTPCYYIKAGE
jgi:hypothetical protein